MKKEINVEIGQRIWKIRESRKMSREKLAELLNITPVFLACVEYGQKGVSLTTLKKMCETLQVSADYLLLGKESAVGNRTEAQALVDSIDPKYQEVTADFLRTLIQTFADIRKTEKESPPQNSSLCDKD